MTEPQNRLAPGSMAAELVRITQLRRASEFVGQKALAEALDIQPRSLRAKLDSDRGVSDADLMVAAAAVEARATAMLALSNSIRERLA